MNENYGLHILRIYKYISDVRLLCRFCFASVPALAIIYQQYTYADQVKHTNKKWMPRNQKQQMLENMVQQIQSNKITFFILSSQKYK